MLVSSSLCAPEAINSWRWESPTSFSMHTWKATKTGGDARGSPTKTSCWFTRRGCPYIHEKRHWSVRTFWCDGPNHLDLPMEKSPLQMSMRNQSLQWHHVAEDLLLEQRYFLDAKQMRICNQAYFRSREAIFPSDRRYYWSYCLHHLELGQLNTNVSGKEVTYWFLASSCLLHQGRNYCNSLKLCPCWLLLHHS